MFAADIGGDHVVHLVAADARRIAIGNPAQRQHRDLGRPAADIDHHRAARLGHGQARADRGGERFVDQPHARRAGVGRGVADGAALDRGRGRRHAHDDMASRAERPRDADSLFDEMLDHLFGDIDVGDHAVAQGTQRLDIGGRLAHHQLRLVADHLDAADAVACLERDHRRFVEHDPAIAGIDDSIHGPEIDGDIMRGR